MRLAAIAMALFGCGAPGTAPSMARGEVQMSTESRSPSGELHPGEIVFEDQTTGRTWTERAADNTETMAWVDVGGTWEAVTRVVVSGTAGYRRITKFGRDGEMLESTTQGRPRAEPEPEPIPEPSPD